MNAGGTDWRFLVERTAWVDPTEADTDGDGMLAIAGFTVINLLVISLFSVLLAVLNVDRWLARTRS